MDYTLQNYLDSIGWDGQQDQYGRDAQKLRHDLQAHGIDGGGFGYNEKEAIGFFDDRVPQVPGTPTVNGMAPGGGQIYGTETGDAPPAVLDPNPMPADFNSAYYLEAYPNVAEAVERGDFNSAYQHYDLYGRDEGRSYLPTDAPQPDPDPQPDPIGDGGLTQDQLDLIDSLIGGGGGGGEPPPVLQPGGSYQGPAGGGGGGAAGGAAAPGISLPNYGQPAQRNPFQFGQRQPQANPITPAGNQVYNNMNNQAMGGGQQQPWQARAQGLLGEDEFITLQGLLNR